MKRCFSAMISDDTQKKLKDLTPQTLKMLIAAFAFFFVPYIVEYAVNGLGEHDVDFAMEDNVVDDLEENIGAETDDLFGQEFDDLFNDISFDDIDNDELISEEPENPFDANDTF